jgi:hypothetical protein
MRFIVFSGIVPSRRGTAMKCSEGATTCLTACSAEGALSYEQCSEGAVGIVDDLLFGLP